MASSSVSFLYPVCVVVTQRNIYQILYPVSTPGLCGGIAKENWSTFFIIRPNFTRSAFWRSKEKVVSLFVAMSMSGLYPGNAQKASLLHAYIRYVFWLIVSYPVSVCGICIVTGYKFHV